MPIMEQKIPFKAAGLKPWIGVENMPLFVGYYVSRKVRTVKLEHPDPMAPRAI